MNLKLNVPKLRKKAKAVDDPQLSRKWRLTRMILINVLKRESELRPPCRRSVFQTQTKSDFEKKKWSSVSHSFTVLLLLTPSLLLLRIIRANNLSPSNCSGSSLAVNSLYSVLFYSCQLCLNNF